MVAVGFACEALLVYYLANIANDITRVCPARSPYQVACANVDCYTCLPGYLNCASMLKMHAAGSLAYELIRQLPSALRHDIMSDGNGVFFFSDINWAQFHRDVKPGKTLTYYNL